MTINLEETLPKNISINAMREEATGVHKSIAAPPSSPAHVAATESIPESVSVREILQENHKRWEQFGPLQASTK